MLKSLSLPDLVRSISKNEAEKRDFLVDTNRMAIHTTSEGQSMLRFPTGRGSEEFELAETARNQIADRLEVPFRFLEHLRMEHPAVLDTTVNALFKFHNEPRFVRTLGPDCRAILSPKYKVLDNFEFLGCFLPILAELPDAEIFETHLSQTHLHISIILRRTQTEVKPNDIVRFGIQLGNSEVGLGSLSAQFFAHRLVCSNGMVCQEMDDNPMRRVHLGRRIQDLSLVNNDRQVWMDFAEQIRCMAADSNRFPQIASRMRMAADTMITSSPAEAVEDLAKKHLLSKDESAGVLSRFIDSSDMSLWSLANAITEEAKLATTSNRKVQLQVIGAKLLPMAS